MQPPLELPQMGGGSKVALDEKLRSHRERNASGECGTCNTLTLICSSAFFTLGLPAVPNQSGEDMFGALLQLLALEGGDKYSTS